jgi:hypothetical protein
MGDPRLILEATRRQPAKSGAGANYYGGAWGSSYFGAQTSDSRGRLILPTVRTEDQIHAPERTILALKSRLLAENYGPGAALWNLATLIGALKPQAAGKDLEWNKLAEAYFDRVTTSPLTFDAGGRLTLNTYQPMTTFRRMVDGDMATVLTRSNTGHARVMGYEGLCIESGRNQAPPEWIDGVRCNPQTRFPLEYSFAERGPKGETIYRVVPASKVIHHMTQRSFGARRGVPALAHALNDFHDIIETKSFQKQMIKVASLIGLTRRADPGPNAMPYNLGIGTPMQQTPWQSPTALAEVTTEPEAKLKFEQAVEGGLMSSAPFDVVHDDRPHPNGEEFKKSLLRECAIGLNFPPQLLFYMDDPGGAYARIILELASRAIIDHHVNHLAPMVRRLWAYVIALGTQLGEIPYPSSSDWMKIRLTPPRMPTADIGRTGRLMIELRRACMTTHSRLYEEQGLDYEEEMEQCAREFQQLMQLEAKYSLPPGVLTQSLVSPQASAAMVQDHSDAGNSASGSDPEDDTAGTSSAAS